MSEPQTPAERVAALALARFSGDLPGAHAKQARAVVALLRPLIEAEAFEEMADRFEEYGSLVGEKAWPFVTELRMSAEARRAALEGEQDHA